ncbi:MAG: NADH-quinone oxidoreductase subunit NuoF [Candidatus Sericytochromatia bacterium]|nr:NADH-quinone oxidoreductase subunit NuoF [Candidatus Sericytochromatia bacterium]
METNLLTKYFGVENSRTLDFYLSHGGYDNAKKALKMTPEEVIDEVKKSGLRGRGGAGFPTGVKWGFLPKDNPKPRYLCVNADESEPGTFKDRYIMEDDPHLLLEGIVISCYAIKSNKAFIYIRGEYHYGYTILEKAIEEAYQKGYIGKNIFDSGFDIDIVLHRGAGAYICGEETALIESLEGKKGQPRIKPPFPAIEGVFRCPTIVNNVATIASVPWIIEHGFAEYAKFGTEKSTGTFLFSISGHVNKPGIYEVPMGMPLLQFIEEKAGGVIDGKKIKAVVPGGSSTPILTPKDCETVNLDYESIAAHGSMLGSGAIIVLAEGTCIVRSLLNLMHFYAHESCGQCSPCREGVDWMYKTVHKIEEGTATEKDLQTVLDLANNMEGKTICVFSAAAAMPARSYITKFKDEFIAHFDHKGCPYEKYNYLAD